METPPEPHHERIRTLSGHPLEHRLLRESVLQLLMSEHMAFRNGLQGVDTGGCPVAHKEDLASTALAEHSYELEVVDDDLALRFLLLEQGRVDGLRALLPTGAPPGC